MTRQRSLAIFVVMLLLLSLASPVYAAPSVSVGDTSLEPGQAITFSVSGAPTGNNAWIGIFPYEPNASWWSTNWDAADISYHYFRNISGSGSFNLPYKEGDYIIGVFEADDSNDIPIAKSSVIQVRFKESSVSLSSSSLEPGDTITFSYTNPPSGNSAWIGLFPYEPNASWWNSNWDEADISYHYLRNITGQSDSFIMPSEPGSYIIGLFTEDASQDMPLAMSPVISVGAGIIGSDSNRDFDDPDDMTTVVDDTSTGGEQVILEVTNISGVSNTPTSPTKFTIDTPYIITYLHTYHYYNNNTPAGTIGLRAENGTMYGPWQSEGTAGQGGVQNADWHVYTYQEIPAGTYTVVDSNPSTWSHNSGSGGRGFATVKGIQLGNATKGALIGTVLEIDEGLAVSGVEVNIYYNGYLAGTTYTDSNGEYVLNAYEGTYLLEFVYNGYTTTLYKNVPIYSGGMTNFDHILNYPY